MRKLFWVVGVAAAFLALTFGFVQIVAGQTPTPGEKPALNTSETQGDSRREVTGPENAGPNAPQAPTLGFIDSPSGTCYQPDPKVDACYLTWYYFSVDASPNYMIAMTVTVNSIGAVARTGGFFQTNMYIPYNMLGPGVRVACGAPNVSGNGPNLGESYAWTIRARDSANLSSANYGTSICPAFAP